MFYPTLANTQNFNTLKNNDTRRLRQSLIDSKNMVAIVSVSHRNKGRGVLKLCSSLAFQVSFPVNTDD